VSVGDIGATVRVAIYITISDKFFGHSVGGLKPEFETICSGSVMLFNFIA
jgi:hypothetical protein